MRQKLTLNIDEEKTFINKSFKIKERYTSQIDSILNHWNYLVHSTNDWHFLYTALHVSIEFTFIKNKELKKGNKPIYKYLCEKINKKFNSHR